MKIITDILCLILKVRTQLISSSWIYDQASHSVVHPAFQTIRSSYLAFKDYSGFLYKGKQTKYFENKGIVYKKL